MILRGDLKESIAQRLSLDDSKFDINNIDFDGEIIDSTNISIEEVADIVYKKYKGL